MTRDEIIEQVRDNLYDVGMEHWESYDLQTTLQDGYEEVAVFTQCIEKVTTLNLVGNLSYYKMTSYISDYYRPIAMWNNQTNRWLVPISIAELNESHPRWETLNGEPSFFSPLGLEYVALARKPATTAGSLLVFYAANANQLTGTETPTIPESSHKVLENYTTSVLLDQALEFTKAQKYFDDYLKDIRTIVRHINSRSLPDRLFFLSEVVGTLK